MITHLYFVRHAESDKTVTDAFSRPLTEKGMEDAARLPEYFASVPLTQVFSSPYIRAVNTVRPLSEKYALPIQTDDRLREWNGGRWFSQSEFFQRIERMFSDNAYSEGGAESMHSLKKRNIEAASHLLTRFPGEHIAIGTHGLALSSIIDHYWPEFGFQGFMGMLNKMPYIVHMQFDGFTPCSMDFTDPLSENEPDPILRHDTRPIGTLGAYKYVVIFARHNGKWVYCRAKTRKGYETAGGHIENGETPLQAAKRELYEETGARESTITPLFDYTVYRAHSWANGQVFFADIQAFDPLPDFEMQEVVCLDGLPETMRFPDILPVIYEKSIAIIEEQNL